MCGGETRGYATGVLPDLWGRGQRVYLHILVDISLQCKQ